MSEHIYTDRELACAHLRKILEGSDVASLVRPDAHESVWSHILRGLHTPSPRVFSAAKNLADHYDTIATNALAHYERIGTDGGLDGWREWVQRECAAELAEVTAPKPLQSPAEQPEVHITPTLTLAEFARVCAEWQRGSVRIEMFTDGKVRIGDTFYNGGVNAACANYYDKAVKSLREQATEAQNKAAALHAVLAKVVKP